MKIDVLNAFREAVAIDGKVIFSYFRMYREWRNEKLSGREAAFQRCDIKFGPVIGDLIPSCFQIREIGTIFADDRNNNKKKN